MYNEFKTATHMSDQCLTKGICSTNTTQSSINEIILLYLKELAFYVLRLKNLGITNEAVKKVFIDDLFNTIACSEFNQEQFSAMMTKLYEYINQSKFLYEKVCNERNLPVETNKSYFKYSKKFDLTDAIRKGEKYYIKKMQSYSSLQSSLYDIMLFIAKSMDIKLVELERLGKTYEEAYYTILTLFDKIRPRDCSNEEVKEIILEAVQVYYKLVREVYYALEESYGKSEVSEISFSTQPGKAILVSGADFKKLEYVLEATKDSGVNVYTHGREMIGAHSYPKLKAYPNLKGHFGISLDGSLVDFASFPGAILMTKGTLQSVEYLYRGRLFTMDPIPPSGVIKIKDNNFEQLVSSALNAKGFVKSTTRPSYRVGFNRQEIYDKAQKVIEKYMAKEIRHIYVIGLLNFPVPKVEYFDDFLNSVPDDCYVFSLAHKKSGPNIFHLESYYDYSLLYGILNTFEKSIPVSSINMTVFLYNCDKHTISNLLYLKKKGVKSVFMPKCPPTLVSPLIMNTMQDEFNIMEVSTPNADLEKTLST